MLERLAIKNFKSIKEIKIDRLSKLNVFVGPNNSGKSSILQSVAFLAQSLENNITYKGKFVDLGSFSHTIFTGKTKNEIVIELWFNLADEMKGHHWRHKFNIFPLLTKFEVEIGSEGILRQTLECPVCEISCRFYLKSMNGRRSTLEYNNKEIPYKGRSPSSLLAWNLAAPATGTLPYINVEEVTFINGLLQGIKRRLQNTYYFSPTRAIREWEQTLREVNSFGARGEDAISMLHHIYSNEPFIFNKISKWVEKLGAGKLISGIRGRNSSIVLEDPYLKKRVNIVSCGFGINQLLSVVGQCFASPKRSIIMIEEPEIHLHPGAIGTLIDMFLETISEDKQLIITTHSDRLIFELWARFKLGILKKEDVSLFLVNKSPKGTLVKSIQLSSKVKEIRKELKSLYKPRSPLEELLNLTDESEDKRLSEKDLSEI